jgi:putative transposase
MQQLFRRNAHCVFRCDYHVVWATKYRRAVLVEGVLAYLKESIKALPKHHPDLIIKEINGEVDHIHILIAIPPQRSVGSVVRIIKASTAKDLNDKFPFLRKVYWGTRSIWSSGYFVTTVGADEQVIRRYIENQGQEDAGQAQLDLS